MQPSFQIVKPSAKQTISSDELECFLKCFENDDAKDLSSTEEPEEKSPLANRMNDDIFVIDNIFSRNECERLQRCVDNCSALSFWNPCGASDEVKKFRDVDTIEIVSHDLSNLIWQRIQHTLTLPDICIVDDADDSHELGTEGTWIADGINENILFARYPALGNFAPHTDGKVVKTFNRRSFFSVIIYLNSPEGGSTNFYSCESLKKLELKETSKSLNKWTLNEIFLENIVPAIAGRAVIFRQNLVHEGEITQSCKYIIRTDVFCSRVSLFCNEIDEEAYKMYLDAESLAEEGKVKESINLFKAAFRLSPSLRQILKQ
jgi:hypothetical protein